MSLFTGMENMADSPFDHSLYQVESLTRREREILARLAGDLYNREIAEALTLAPNSVKWYTHQIYAKLGVNSRQEAIRRARELGLLELKTSSLFRSHNLPAAPNPFIGRQTELARIRGLLSDRSYRLLTLTGPGGVGKTRLALQAANELQGNFPQGAWLVELAALTDPELLPQTVAAVFDLRTERERPALNGLMDYLRSRNLLLVLDNCEHLLTACARLATSLLKACPDLHILATSREPLGIAAERNYPVPSLPFPEEGRDLSPEEMIQYEAVDLFTCRARAAWPDFELDGQNGPAVAQICRHLDGIPLALELAAARIRLADTEQIASQLEDHFSLLTGGDRSALPRLQTMRTSIDWSYQLLAQAERSLLMHLAVFSGGWTLPAAQAVCACEALAKNDILDLHGRLVDQSLLQMLRRRGQETRYRLLETVRQYAWEKACESGRAGEIRDRHLEYFLGLARRAEPQLVSARQAAWFDALEREHDNFRLALGWSLEGGSAGPEAGLRMAVSLWWFWFVRGHKREGGQWLERTLAACKSQEPVDLVIRANALARLPWMEYFQTHTFEDALELGRTLGLAGRESVAFALWGMGVEASGMGFYERAKSLEAESLQLFRELGHRWGICETLTVTGRAMIRLGEPDQAQVVLEQSLELARQAGDINEIATAFRGLGEAARVQGDYDQAARFYNESRTFYNKINQSEGAGWGQLAYLALQKGDLHQAASLFGRTIALAWEMGDQRSIANYLEALSLVVVLSKRPERAARLLGAAQALREANGLGILPDDYYYRTAVENLHLQLDSLTYNARLAEGREMAPKEAVAYALSDDN
jgi:predicted ATPase/DNA-binding CsgD family transcriptional regulator